MKKSIFLISALAILLALSGPASAAYNYAQSLVSWEDLHSSPAWTLTTWTGLAPTYGDAVTGAPDYVPDPLAGDALGWQQGYGNFVLDFGYEFTEDLTLWHFGGINWSGNPNNLVYMRVSSDNDTWSDPLQLRDVSSGGDELFMDTYSLDDFSVLSARYLKIEKISGGPKTGKFIDAAGVNAVPIPGAIWLLGSGLLGLMGIRRTTG